MKCILVLASLFTTMVTAQLGPDSWDGGSLGYPDGTFADGLDDGQYDYAYPQGVDDAENYDGIDGYLGEDGDDGSYDGSLARRWIVPADYPLPLIRRDFVEPRSVSPVIFVHAAKLKKNKFKKQKFNFVNKKAKKINRKKKTVFIG